MYLKGRHNKSQAFALPTVLIASVVLLMVLAVSVTATAAVRTTLKNQYYIQLAQVAGESGVAYAKACLAANGNVPLWTDAKPLTPATDCSGNLILSPSVKALVVAGGGSGGTSSSSNGGGGGGGGGGLLYTDSYPVTTGSSYPVTIGGGGGAVAAANSRGVSGGNSVFGTMTAIGGGGGGSGSGSASLSSGLTGGSGGGGGYVGYTFQAGAAGTSGQGNKGGDVLSNNNGGGGGGAGGAGGNTNSGGPSGTGGAKGNGLTYSISGSSIMYAQGGEGGAPPSGAKNGDANTGSGGSGVYAAGTSSAGGSGIVVVSYPTNSGINASGGTKTTSGSNTIHKFTTSGTLSVSSSGTSSCPSDPKCSVQVSGNVRSSFSVPKPTVDGTTGQAITIANNGYVEVTRTSNGSVWRSYKQPSVQPAVVPDLCSGNATAARGWNAAVKTTQQDSLPSASSAQTISVADSPVNTGAMYFRRDFNVGLAASYDLNVYTSSTQDIADTFIDGSRVSTAAGSLATNAVSLASGCHTIVVRLTNATLAPRPSDFTAAITRNGDAIPTVVTDTKWRVSTGDAVHFSTNNYYEDPTVWQQVLDLGIWTNTALPWGGAPTNWASVSGDSLAEWITTQYSSGGLNRPGDSYAWLRDPTPFTTAAATTVRVTNYCDDKCDLYLDGNQIMSPAAGSGIVSKSITIQPGTHTFGIRLYNLASANVGAALFAATDLSTGAVLARSDPGWDSTAYWLPSASVLEPYSYDSTFLPTPAIQKSANAKILVVGGGGGGGSDMGGGGGGGAVVYNAAYPLTADRTYTVTVGAGGNGGPAGQSQVRGTNGQNSSFGTIRAIGGGGGASEYASNVSPPGAGASAGGSAGCNQNLYAGFAVGQGYGSAGTVGCYYPTGGGGAGGAGATNPATGGVGVSNNILGTSYFFGGGGGGSGYTGIGGNGGNGGGGGGAVGTTTGGSGIYPGYAGGGGTTATQTNKPGGAGGTMTGGGGGGGSHYNANNYGGSGGSGTVIISFPTGTMVVSAYGGWNDYSGSTPGFTTYGFIGSGTFVVTSIN